MSSQTSNLNLNKVDLTDKITDTWTNYNANMDTLDTAITGKQATLVSGTNIKTINNNSILGSGNITIEGGGGTSDYTDLTNKPQINSVELTGDKSGTDLGLVNSTDVTNIVVSSTDIGEGSELTTGTLYCVYEE